MTYQTLPAFALSLFLAAQHQDANQKDAKLLQGTWTVMSLENDGKKAPDSEIKGMKMTFVGNKLIISKGTKSLGAGTFKVDRSKKPHPIDYKEGPDISSPYDVGIIQIDGDTMKYCTTADRKKRPTSFDSKQGWLFVLKKAKK